MKYFTNIQLPFIHYSHAISQRPYSNTTRFITGFGTHVLEDIVLMATIK